MKRDTLNNLIVENMKTILGFSISRLQNIQEAEELASEIVYKLLVSGRNLRDEAKFYPFMWREMCIRDSIYLSSIHFAITSLNEPNRL